MLRRPHDQRRVAVPLAVVPLQHRAFVLIDEPAEPVGQGRAAVGDRRGEDRVPGFRLEESPLIDGDGEAGHVFGRRDQAGCRTEVTGVPDRHDPAVSQVVPGSHLRHESVAVQAGQIEVRVLRVRRRLT